MDLTQEDKRAASWPASDEALIELARTDPEAFGELYERHVKRVYTYVYYRLHSRQDAEDLTARTFMQALAHFPRYRQQGVPFSAWLLRIAHNLVANWYRDNKREIVPLEEALSTRSHEDGPEEAATEKEERQELLAALAELPDERQQLIVLRFGHGLRAADIAVVMGRTEGAVKALLHRTLVSLRKQMDERAAPRKEQKVLPFVRR
ncbi:MAG: RNA polymerase sigma factor [Chloroflexota bacterium]